MDLAISPYHLTTREPAAMAAMLLGARVFTILPVPADGVSKPSVRRAMHDCPRYARLLESWRWSGPLWRGGVVRSTLEGKDAMGEARAADAGIAREPQWQPLRRFQHDGLFGAGQAALDLVCADLLKGGPDPGICVPLVAGLDRFAAAHGLMAVRSGGEQVRSGRPPSLAQRAEALMGTPVFSAAVPVLTAAGGEVLARAREMLEPDLHPLREAMSLTLREADAKTIQARVRAAAGRYHEAFEAARRELVGRDDEAGQRVTAGLVRIEARRWPIDAALRSTLAALNTARATGRMGDRSSAGPAPAPDLLLRALVVTPMAVA